MDISFLGSLDDLTGQVQKELDASVLLDNSLLSTFDSKPSSVLPNDYLISILKKIIQDGFQV